MRGAPEYHFAHIDDAAALSGLIIDAYRGTGPVKGWTSEAHLLGGQRIDAGTPQEILMRDDSRILQVDWDGALCACIHLAKTSPSHVEFGLFAVHPALQGRSLGRSVMEYAERWAKATWGARGALLTVIDARRDIAAWYRRMGYVFTGERRAPHTARSALVSLSGRIWCLR
ncbi:GNAT family N-acetyltransferase [Acidiferrobacter sp.]|uniref:GNAT family N-acetyltransferase n=1 Tax=Acidiferrobacter sp. TaxID=1872107 RepID=UPI00260DE9E4|nr:GNAT family N-acetyltransferase [Acidiferrobacter sp.]